MAAASYVAPPGYDYRRPIGGNYSSSYDTPVSSLRRRSPSPSSSSRRYAPYDSYVPRGGAPSRVEYENNYRPNTWRPGRYHSRSPSPDRFERTRPLEPHYGSHWRPPSRDEPRPPTSPVPPIAREKGRRDIMAERMFESSDAWKQSQPERPMRRDFSEPFLDRYPEHRMRHVRDFSPLRSVARNEYPSLSAGDSYRPLANGRSYRDSYAFARSDTYRPCYDNEYRETWPHPVPPRSSGFHDRGDVRPLSTARSIASTPSHHANSPRGDIPNRNRYSYPGPVGYSAPSSSRERSLTPPTTKSRDSSLCEEPPRKKFKSYTSSRSSSVSGQNRLEPPPRSHLENPESHQSVQSPTPVYHTPFPVNAQSQIDSECSTPRDNLTPGDKSDAPDCPQKILCQPTSPLHPPLMYSVQAKAEPKAHDTISCLPTPPRDNPNVSLTPRIADVSTDLALDGLNEPVRCTEIEASVSAESISSLIPDVTTTDEVPVEDQSCAQPTISTVDAELPSSRSRIEANEDAPPIPPESSHSPESHPISPGTIECPNETQILQESEQRSAAVDHTVPPIAENLETNILENVVQQNLPEIQERRTDSATEIVSKALHAKPSPDAIRAVVIARLRCDRQTRSERVLPIIRANEATVKSIASSSGENHRSTGNLIDGQYSEEHLATRTAIRRSFVHRFEERQSVITEKAQKLKEEYMSLHEKWVAHCNRLDNMQKGGTPEESVVPSGRSTRRSAAILGDAVRSDLEMEQIIASLGVEELTDPNYLAIKNVAKIPDMISVTEGSVRSLYDDTNNIVDDPVEFYSSSSALEYWTEEERAIFEAEFAARPKQFGHIAARLPNKTPAQCVTYYYLHKKTHVDFRKAVAQHGAGKRRKNGRRDKQKGNGLMADIRRHDDEVSRATPAAQANGNTTGSRRKRAAILRPNGTEPRRTAPRRSAAQQIERTSTSSGTTPDPEPELQRRRRRATAPVRTILVAGPDEGEAEEQDAERKGAKRGRKARKPKASATANPSEEPGTPVGEGLKFIDQTESVARRKPTTANVSWADEDKDLFLTLLAQYGDDFKRIAASMPNKTTIQVSAFYKSNVEDLNLERVAAGAPKRSPTPDSNHSSWKDGAVYPGSGVMSPVSARASSIDPAPTAADNSTHDRPLSRKLQISDLLITSASGSEPTSFSQRRVEFPPQPHSPLQPRIHPPSNFTRFVTTTHPSSNIGASNRSTFAATSSIFSVDRNPPFPPIAHSDTRHPDHEPSLRVHRHMPDEPVTRPPVLGLRHPAEDHVIRFERTMTSSPINIPHHTPLSYRPQESTVRTDTHSQPWKPTPFVSHTAERLLRES